MKYLIYILPFSINTIELITIFIGIYHYKKYKNTILKYFLWFLVYGFLTEMMGVFVAVVLKFPNYIVFNIYAVLHALFFLWLFGSYFKNKKSLKIIQFFKKIFVVGVVIDVIFLEKITAYLSFTFYLNSLLLIITVIMFFIEILNSKAILKIKGLLIFWIGAGILLFELGSSPVFIAKDYINYSSGLTYGYIFLVLNFISSLCFSLGFIWSKKGLDY